MSERQRIGVPRRCRPSRDVQRLIDVFLTFDLVKKKKWKKREVVKLARKRLRDI